MTPNVHGSSVWELTLVTRLVTRILRWLPDFRKTRAPLTCPKSVPVSSDCNNLHDYVPFIVTYITTFIGILRDASVRQDFDSYKIVFSFPAFFHYIRRLYGKKMKLGCGIKCRKDTSLSRPSLFGAL